MKKIKFNESDLQNFLQSVKEKFSNKKGIPESVTLQTNPSIKLKEEEKVSVIFENEAYKKMTTLVRVATKEIGWYGTVERLSEKEFVVKDIFVSPQVVTSTTVDTDDEEFTNWCNILSDETFNSLRFYGHSHVYMGVTPSGTDIIFQDNQIQNIRDFYIFAILNKHNASWFNIYDIEKNILYEKDDIKFEYYVDPQEEWAKEQIKEHVKERTYATPATQTYTLANNNTNTTKNDNVNKEYDPDWWKKEDWRQNWGY